MEVDVMPREKWCKRFMRSVGYSYKKPKKDTLTYHNDYERVERIENLRLNIVLFQETYAISEQRTVNIIETACRLLPLHSSGWLQGNENVAIQGDHQQSTTVTLAIPQCSGVVPIVAQVLHRGTTVAVLPPQPWAPRVTACPSCPISNRLGIDRNHH
eukprot:2603845-Amphidinium_carterae.1